MRQFISSKTVASSRIKISDEIYASTNYLSKTSSFMENCCLDDGRTEDKSRAINICEIVSPTFFKVQRSLIN